MKLFEDIINWLFDVTLIAVLVVTNFSSELLDYFDIHAAGLTFLVGLPLILLRTWIAVRELFKGRKK